MACTANVFTFVDFRLFFIGTVGIITLNFAAAF